MELQPGAQILDCTMGMANDAVVLSFATGADGVVTALESSPLIYAVTSYGLQHWQTNSQPMKQAMERIQTICCDYRVYLQNLAPDCYDFLYFDPMFERPVLQSAGIAPLRRSANYAPLTQEILTLAKKIARQKVVVRHRVGTLRSLQFDSIMGGKYSSLAYGFYMQNKKESGTMQPLVILVGPTAVGKTVASIGLAKALNGEIISGDSMQIFRGLDIGTAKITVSEMAGVPHHLLDIKEPWETFSVAEFKERADAAIAQIAGRGKLPILVGGTGFYINSVLYDYHFGEANCDLAYRQYLQQYVIQKWQRSLVAAVG